MLFRSECMSRWYELLGVAWPDEGCEGAPDEAEGWSGNEDEYEVGEGPE